MSTLAYIMIIIGVATVAYWITKGLVWLCK